MWLTHLRWPVLLLASISIAACVNTAPREQRVVIVKPVPSRVVVVPAKYVDCHMVSGRWMYTTWIPEHRVCYYSGGPENIKKVAWVEGYYVCTKYSHKTHHCKHWSWRAPHRYDGYVGAYGYYAY